LALKLWRLVALGYCNNDDAYKIVSEMKHEIVKNEFKADGDFENVNPA